ncbi:hypothetical protein JCM19297_589 [Nonlabens ulvanivorans]|nr:hypothetical protein JCM19297_589 [Nonlabens ulvanivorans]
MLIEIIVIHNYLRIKLSTAVINFFTEKGFVKYSSAPSLRPFSISAALLFADKKMTFAFAKAGLFFIISIVS